MTDVTCTLNYTNYFPSFIESTCVTTCNHFNQCLSSSCRKKKTSDISTDPTFVAVVEDRSKLESATLMSLICYISVCVIFDIRRPTIWLLWILFMASLRSVSTKIVSVKHVFTKQHKVQRSKQSKKKTTRSLDIVHNDLCGPVKAGNAFKKLLIFTGNYNWFT